jgi:hypothetical protein
MASAAPSSSSSGGGGGKRHKPKDCEAVLKGLFTLLAELLLVQPPRPAALPPPPPPSSSSAAAAAAAAASVCSPAPSGKYQQGAPPSCKLNMALYQEVRLVLGRDDVPSAIFSKYVTSVPPQIPPQTDPHSASPCASRINTGT